MSSNLNSKQLRFHSVRPNVHRRVFWLSVIEKGQNIYILRYAGLGGGGEAMGALDKTVLFSFQNETKTKKCGIAENVEN